MTDAEFKRELETLNDSFNRVRRISAEWHAFINGKGKARPTTELAYLFRSGSIVVKDTVALIAKVAVDKDAKNRVRMIYSHVKSCVGSLDEFIMVPTVRITADVDVVRRLFSLIYERLKDGMVDAIGGVDLKVPEYGGDNKAHNKAMKDLMHRLSQVMIGDKKLPAVRKYTHARDYINGCSREGRYYTQCKAIQDAIKIYEWKPSSQLTYCKQGSIEVKKTNDKRQAKINKRKRLFARDIKDAWHDGLA